MLGHPRLRLRVTSDRPRVRSAKITDVFPDGASSLVVRGMMNLAQRATNTEAKPVVPGEPIELDLELEAVAWTFEAGHRIRLDLAGADWPNAWPPPYAATLRFDRADAELELPVLEGPPPVPADPAGSAPWSGASTARRAPTTGGGDGTSSRTRRPACRSRAPATAAAATRPRARSPTGIATRA